MAYRGFTRGQQCLHFPSLGTPFSGRAVQSDDEAEAGNQSANRKTLLCRSLGHGNAGVRGNFTGDRFSRDCFMTEIKQVERGPIEIVCEYICQPKVVFTTTGQLDA